MPWSELPKSEPVLLLWGLFRTGAFDGTVLTREGEPGPFADPSESSSDPSAGGPEGIRDEVLFGVEGAAAVGAPTEDFEGRSGVVVCGARRPADEGSAGASVSLSEHPTPSTAVPPATCGLEGGVDWAGGESPPNSTTAIA